MFMRILTIIFIVLIALIGATFAILNGEPILVKYYLGEVESPLSLVLGVTFVLGLLIGIITNLVFVIKLRFENSSLRRKNKKLEDELAHYQASPFSTDQNISK